MKDGLDAMADVIALTCPVCGAPLSPANDRCNYCGSIIVLKTDHPKIDPKRLNKSVIDKHIADYRRVVRKDPHDETAHYGLGVAYFNLGLTDDAVEELSQAARLMPENPHIQTQLAVALKEAADQGGSQASAQIQNRINTALRLDPNHLEAALLQLTIMLDSEQYEESELLLKRIRRHNPDRTSLVTKDFLVNEIVNLLSRDRWEHAAFMVDELARNDEEAAKAIVLDYIEPHREDMPMTLTRKRSESQVVKHTTMVRTNVLLGFIFGIVAAAVALSISDTDVSRAVAILSLVASPFLGLLFANRAVRREMVEGSITIEESPIFSNNANLTSLAKVAEAISMMKRGKMERVHL